MGDVRDRCCFWLQFWVVYACKLSALVSQPVRLMPIPSCIGTHMNVLSRDLITTGYSIIFSCRVRLSTTHHRTKDASDGVHLQAATAALSKTPGQYPIRFNLWSPSTSNSQHSQISFISPPLPRNLKPSNALPRQRPHSCLASGVIHAPLTLHQNCHSCQSVSFQEAGAYYLYAGLISKSFPHTVSFPHNNKS